MMIKITKCSNTNKGTLEVWYENKIGEEFEVIWSNEYYYFVKNKRGANFINILDV